MPAPTLLVLAGLPGTGKSTLARAWAARRRAVWLRVDAVEAALLESGLPRSFETGLAAYVVVRDLARDQLTLGRDVVIDAVNGVEEAREMWRELATRTGARRRVVELVLPDRREHRRRVEGRGQPTPPLPAPTWAEVVAREYLPWKEPVLRIDGRRPAAENVARVERYLARSAARSPPRRRAIRRRTSSPRTSGSRRSSGTRPS